MKTIIREMVETIKQLFAQKQQMQEPVVANYEVSEIVEQKTLKKKEESEKTGEKTGKSKELRNIGRRVERTVSDLLMNAK